MILYTLKLCLLLNWRGNKEKIAEITPKKSTYIDESGVNTYFQREYGRALRGKKLKTLSVDGSFSE